VSRLIGVFMLSYTIFTLALISSGISMHFVISFFCGIGISMGVSWFFVWRGLDEVQEHRALSVDRSIEGFMTDDYSRGFRDMENRAAVDAWQTEMSSEKPNTDIVIVMATRANVKKYEELFAGSAGTLIRKDIPFKVVPYDGNDGAAYAAAFRYISENHPNLKDNGRAVILVTGVNEWKNITRPVSELGVEGLTLPGGREIMNIEYQLMNGYKASRALAGDNRGGKIFIDAELHYVGPIRRRGEVTLVGSWASYDQVKEQNLSLVLGTYDGRARKIYNNFKLEEIIDKLLRHMLKGAYDKTNTKKRQMPVLGGITMFSFDTPDQEREFVGLLDGAPEGFDVTGDVIRPLVLLKREGFREMYKSLFSRDMFKDKGEREPFLRLFDSYEQRYGRQNSMPFDFWVYFPHLHETYITRA